MTRKRAFNINALVGENSPKVDLGNLIYKIYKTEFCSEITLSTMDEKFVVITNSVEKTLQEIFHDSDEEE